MGNVKVFLPGREYDILIGNDNFPEEFPARFKAINPGRNIAVVTNPTVGKLYLGRLLAALAAIGITPVVIEIPDGEEYKSQEWASKIIDRLLEEKFDRRSVIIALGGGVIGDITGYAAAVFLRGISYVQIPTTVIAQVDSSIGGKTGINHRRGKNLIGAFHQPRLVFIDTAFLKTLERRDFYAGMAEVIKYGVIYDPELFGYLEKNCEKILSFDPECMNRIITRSCEIKAGIVEKDERETTGLRSTLNYGHTIGHAVESLTGYTKFRHGEAVAIGMSLAARLSVKLGFCPAGDMERQQRLISAYGLPLEMPELSTNEVIETIKLDKKVEDREIKFILCRKIGDVINRKVDVEELQRFLG